MRRVPSGFDWPLNKTWEGYFIPEFLRTDACSWCEGYGYSPEARRMHDEWWGYVEFKPEDNGSVPFEHTHPKIWAFAERNVTGAPHFYGTDPFAIDREAQRLAALWNGAWKHHLNQEDVDAQLADGQLHDMTHTWDGENGWQEIVPRPTLTAREVNDFYLTGFGSPSEWTAMKTRAAREGIDMKCAHCKGKGSVEKFKGQRKAAKKWKPTKPPKGDAWQIWETVSEGSPVTPAFDTPEDLAKFWALKNGGDYENALKWIVGPGWAPSGIISGGEIKTAEDIISEGGL
ncbi:hypothetical protein SEA_ZOOMAN_246 [Microbacterium phage Zooman]|nr:hypothetical protein SEA_ZOOMAN_246 [Microbacterium phage Zooman]